MYLRYVLSRMSVSWHKEHPIELPLLGLLDAVARIGGDLIDGEIELRNTCREDK